MTSRSSTSSSKIKLKIMREVSIIFIILIIVEIVVRSWVMSGWLPAPYGQWNREAYPIIMFEAKQINPDIFFIGNSITKNGVSPKIFNHHYKQITGQDMTSYNAAIPGTPAYITITFALEFLIPDYNATTIMWVLRPRELDGDIRDSWYQQWLDFLDVPEVQERLQDQPNKNNITENWWTWHFRHTLKFKLTNMADTPTHKENYGYVPLSQTVSLENFERELSLTPNADQFDPKTLEMIENLIHISQEKNVQIIFVMMPTLYHEFQNSDKLVQVEDQIIEEFRVFLDQYDVPLYDERHLTYDGVLSFEEYKDGVHLNQYGAPIFTKRLVEIYIQEQATD